MSVPKLNGVCKPLDFSPSTKTNHHCPLKQFRQWWVLFAWNFVWRFWKTIIQTKYVIIQTALVWWTDEQTDRQTNKWTKHLTVEHIEMLGRTWKKHLTFPISFKTINFQLSSSTRQTYLWTWKNGEKIRKKSTNYNLFLVFIFLSGVPNKCSSVP